MPAPPSSQAQAWTLSTESTHLAGCLHDTITTTYMTHSRRFLFFSGHLMPQAPNVKFFPIVQSIVSIMPILNSKPEAILMPVSMSDPRSFRPTTLHGWPLRLPQCRVDSNNPPSARQACNPAKTERLLVQQREASARYRERNRDKVLEAGRVRAANRRARGLSSDRVRAREASARYRDRNRAELAQKQRKVRKRAYIDKHGVHAYIQRRFDAPMPSTAAQRASTPPMPAQDSDDAAWDSWGSHSTAPIINIADYCDPCLRR
ncbi:hypothetical protein C8R43DRAFT_1122451 [Mycena crocata]|nr:hypothetical protein C8R43DRAFT_1122451 [Mycena crocata]